MRSLLVSMSRPVLACVVLVFLVLGMGTHARTQVWRSNLTLWTDAARKSPNKPRPFINLGLAQEEIGDLDAALRSHSTSLSLAFQPRLTQYQQAFSRVASETNIARVLAQTGQEAAALRILNDVVARHPLFPHSRWNRGVLLARLGRCHEGDADRQIAAALDPSFPTLECAK